MTKLLYHEDSYLNEFQAIVTGITDSGVVLDQTAFYPGGGGQPNDVGIIRIGGLEYDVSEMAMSTYLCALAHHKPITAFPAFVLRRFEHDEISYNIKSGIESPADLKGRRVGLRSYTFTPGVWARGILSDAYGVDSSDVSGVLYGDEHVSEYQAPDNVIPAFQGSDMVEDLLSGKIDAAIRPGDVNSPDIKPLIPNADAAAQDYFLQSRNICLMYDEEVI